MQAIGVKLAVMDVFLVRGGDVDGWRTDWKSVLRGVIAFIVMLSAAKHLGGAAEILRFAQDDAAPWWQIRTTLGASSPERFAPECIGAMRLTTVGKSRPLQTAVCRYRLRQDRLGQQFNKFVFPRIVRRCVPLGLVENTQQCRVAVADDSVVVEVAERPNGVGSRRIE